MSRSGLRVNKVPAEDIRTGGKMARWEQERESRSQESGSQGSEGQWWRKTPHYPGRRKETPQGWGVMTSHCDITTECQSLLLQPPFKPQSEKVAHGAADRYRQLPADRARQSYEPPFCSVAQKGAMEAAVRRRSAPA